MHSAICSGQREEKGEQQEEERIIVGLLSKIEEDPLKSLKPRMGMGSRQKSYSSHFVSGRRLCGCGDEIVTLTSESVKNPGRKFFGCPNWKNKGSCNFFRWLYEEFKGGEGEGTVGGQCNCSQILIERLTTEIGKMKRNMMGERKK